MKRTMIIVPCYNEGSRLKVNEFVSWLKNSLETSFIFVNDGSRDNTNELIKRVKNTFPKRVQCILIQENKGKAEAVRSGVLKAINDRAENIGYWDADLSTPLDIIDKMIDKMEGGITFVLGSRIKMLGHNIERLPSRHYAGRFFATMASSVLGLPVYDTQCGAKIFKNNIEIKKAFSNPFTVNWTFDVELIGRLKIIKRTLGLKPIEETALEYPLDKWIHTKGSKVKSRDLIVAIKELLKLKKAFQSKGYISKFI